jgi:hypothetical protein
MKLTPGQVREVLGLTQDAFKHWKKVLPPLAGRNGYRPCFTHGDLLAMAFVRALTEDAAVQVGALHAVSTPLFEQCAKHSWAALERTTLVLELPRVRVEFVPEQPNIPQMAGIGIVVPCRPIVSELRAHLLTDKDDIAQGNLRFPPTMIADKARGRRAL